MGSQCLSTASAHAASVAARGASSATYKAPSSATKARGVKMTDQSDAVGAVPRTQEVLMAEVRYGIVFGEMNEVFNGRVHRLLSFLWICAAALTGGSLLTIMGKLEPTVVLPWTVALGIIAAVAGSAQKAFKFQEREALFRAAKKSFEDLEGRGWSMNHGALQKEIGKVRAGAPSGGSWLAPLAYNRACKELGHPEVQLHVSGPAKMLASLAA